MLRFILFLITVISLSNLCHAQEITYRYDFNGNRVKRKIVNNNLYKSPQNKTGNNLNKIELENNVVNVYPNPTTGKFKVAINTKDSITDGIIHIHNMDGIKILSKEIILTITDIDITQKPRGIYILTTNINNREYVLKIIKE